MCLQLRFHKIDTKNSLLIDSAPQLGLLARADQDFSWLPVKVCNDDCIITYLPNSPAAYTFSSLRLSLSPSGFLEYFNY